MSQDQRAHDVHQLEVFELAIRNLSAVWEATQATAVWWAVRDDYRELATGLLNAMKPCTPQGLLAAVARLRQRLEE